MCVCLYVYVRRGGWTSKSERALMTPEETEGFSLSVVYGLWVRCDCVISVLLSLPLTGQPGLHE